MRDAERFLKDTENVLFSNIDKMERQIRALRENRKKAPRLDYQTMVHLQDDAFQVALLIGKYENLKILVDTDDFPAS